MLKYAQHLPYSTQKFPFAQILEEQVFKFKPLSKLHEHWLFYKQRKHGKKARLVYADNLHLRSLMQNLPDHAPFYKLYYRFVQHVIAPLFGGKIAYSNHPKMRVHLAGTPSVSKWHRDVDITKRPDQINVFLPFTPCFDTNTLWCESSYHLKDYQPIPIAYGEALIFDGGYLSHGTIANTTNTTRVSLDFRFAVKTNNIKAPWSQILEGRSENMRIALNAP